MAISLGRLALLGGRPEAPVPPAGMPARPPGQLVWLHARTRAEAGGLKSLAHRLSVEDQCAVVLTCGEPLDGAIARGAPQNPVLHCAPPADRGPEIAGFVEYWRPSAIVLGGGTLSAPLMTAAQRLSCPMILVDAAPPQIIGGLDWLPGQLRRALSPVSKVYALDDGAARAYRKAGLPDVQVGRLEDLVLLPPASEHDRDAAARSLGARPVWLVLSPAPSEETAILAAHAAALQRSHRLLMILLVENPDRAAALEQRMTLEMGWRVASRERGEDPDPVTEVLLVTDPEDFGLCLRLAPLTFLGGTLSGAGPARNPLEVAALGSAVLHGPRGGPWAAELARLDQARGALALQGEGQLADAVIDLQAPDQLARLATAAWGAVSDGAETTAEVIRAILDILDHEGSR